MVQLPPGTTSGVAPLYFIAKVSGERELDKRRLRRSTRPGAQHIIFPVLEKTQKLLELYFLDIKLQLKIRSH